MKGQLSEKLYYSIGELAEYLDVKTSLIRYWEKEFEVLNPKKNAKGTRRFSTKDVEHLKTIYLLVKEKGYTLDGAKSYLAQGENTTLKAVQKLEKIKEILEKIKKELP